MNTAFVLVNTNMGSEGEVTKELREIKEVKDVYGVYGVYDLVVRLEADTLDELKKAISEKVRRLKNVRTTLTMIVV
jgi:DNA-binding Lrp family transcriptional regulator